MYFQVEIIEIWHFMKHWLLFIIHYNTQLINKMIRNVWLRLYVGYILIIV